MNIWNAVQGMATMAAGMRMRLSIRNLCMQYTTIPWNGILKQVPLKRLYGMERYLPRLIFVPVCRLIRIWGSWSAFRMNIISLLILILRKAWIFISMRIRNTDLTVCIIFTIAGNGVSSMLRAAM